jgi:formamidopyrimidine-DNA glycosylase
MPEGPEIRIMSDFINTKVNGVKFKKAFHVERGNKPIPFKEEFNEFSIESRFYGKKIILDLSADTFEFPIFIFMGMSGSWKWVDTNEWFTIKYTRLRFDTVDGKSLLLFGGYLGPKYSLYKNFKTSNSGPDLILEYDKFLNNISENINTKDFSKPIYELLLDQKYFAGVGNYLRSTILYYADVDPFDTARYTINNNSDFLKICKDTLQTSYELNGGQLKDWSNPFEVSSEKFDEWVYYQKGRSIKDKLGRTFWYNPKWSK